MFIWVSADRDASNIHFVFPPCHDPHLATMTTLEVSEKLALIKENLVEVLNPEIIEAVLTEGRNLRIYWGE